MGAYHAQDCTSLPHCISLSPGPIDSDYSDYSTTKSSDTSSGTLYQSKNGPNASISSIDHKLSKLLYSMNTKNLALTVRCILENDPLFEKYKHQSQSIYNAFINYKIKGKTLRKLSRVEFTNELPWIRTCITEKIYVCLKMLSDDDVINILSRLNINLREKDEHKDKNKNTIRIKLPAYLQNVYLQSAIYQSNEYSQDIIDQLVKLGYGTHKQCIVASKICVNYRDINEVIDKLNEIASDTAKDTATELASDISHFAEIEFETYDHNTFQIFVYILCIIHKYDAITIEPLLKALIDIGINGKQFMNTKRITFCRRLKQYNIKAAVASKLHKLIMDNNKNIATYLANNNILLMDSCKKEKLSCYDLARITVSNFQESAYRFLQSMNETMKANTVNGAILAEHYKSKQKLLLYLKQNVFTSTHKSVNVLCDLLWGDYIRHNSKINIKIKGYNRKQLLKYFIALYMYQVKGVMVKYNLNEYKCQTLKRKAVCEIFIKECGFSIGVVTNIVDSIYNNID